LSGPLFVFIAILCCTVWGKADDAACQPGHDRGKTSVHRVIGYTNCQLRHDALPYRDGALHAAIAAQPFNGFEEFPEQW